MNVFGGHFVSDTYTHTGRHTYAKPVKLCGHKETHSQPVQTVGLVRLFGVCFFVEQMGVNSAAKSRIIQRNLSD